MPGAAALILDHRVQHRRLSGQIGGGILEQRLERRFPVERFDKALDGQGEDGFSRAAGDQLVRVKRQYGKDLGQIGGGNLRAAGTHRELVFAAGPPLPQVLDHFSAQRLQRWPALGPSWSPRLYRRRRENRAAEGGARSCLATARAGSRRRLPGDPRRKNGGLGPAENRARNWLRSLDRAQWTKTSFVRGGPD